MQQQAPQSAVKSSPAPQAARGTPASNLPAPLPLSAELLRQISGGVATLTPNGTW